MPTQRPKYLNLFQIRLPVPGIVSILHRVSGAVLFLLIPLLLCLLQSSLASQEAFQGLAGVFSHPVSKVVLIGLVWAYLHHLFAGLRHLALDLHCGTELQTARATSWAVLFGAAALTLIVAVKIW